MENYPLTPKLIEITLTRLQSRINALEQAEARLNQELEVSQKEAAQYWAFIEKANDVIYETDANGYFTYANPASERIAGYTKEELAGHHYLELIRPDYLEKAARTYGKQFVYKISDTYFELPLVVKDGREVWVGQHVQLLTKEDQVVGFQAIARDITDRKLAEEALKTLSLKDELTGLYNRRGFFALAEQGLKNAQRTKTEMLLIFGDLDNLKGINDTFGHKEGDQALAATSQILKETFRESDIIARIGGDEFVILAMNSFDTSAEKMIQRLKKALKENHLQTKRAYILSLSLGIAFFDPRNPCSIDALLAQADKLMYENKPQNGR